jgi:hypothetical protein
LKLLKKRKEKYTASSSLGKNAKTNYNCSKRSKKINLESNMIKKDLSKNKKALLK